MIHAYISNQTRFLFEVVAFWRELSIRRVPERHMDSIDTDTATDAVAHSRNSNVTKVRSVVQDIKASLYPVFFLAVLVSGIFPLIIWGVVQASSYRQADSLSGESSGRIVRSSFIDRSFHPTRQSTKGLQPASQGETAAEFLKLNLQ